MRSRKHPLLGTDILGFATACALLIAFFGWGITFDYFQTISRAEDHLSLVNRLLEEQASVALQNSDRSIQRVLQVLGQRKVASAIQTQEAWSEMSLIAGDVPSKGTLWIFDHEGRVVFSPNAFPAPRLQNLDREYVKALVDGERFHIAGVETGRLTGSRFFAISRRVDAPDGSFAGAVAVSLRTTYFSDLYEKLHLPSTTHIALTRDDGTPLVSVPESQDGTENDELSVPDSIDHEILYKYSKNSSHWTMFAVRHVTGYPLLISVSMPQQTILAAWWRRAIVGIATTSAALLLLISFAWVTYRARFAEHAALTLSEKRGAELEKSVAHNEMLLRELQHRTHNNTQLMLSLLQIGEREGNDQRTTFSSAADRIRALSMSQRMLDGLEPSGDVNMADYLAAICHALVNAEEPRKTSLNLKIASIAMPVGMAQQFGLIVNELLTNSIKHAFTDRPNGVVTVVLHDDGNRLVLDYSDNGVGLQGKQAKTDRNGKGRSLLDRIIRGLGGEAEISGTDGFRISISFAHPAMKFPTRAA